MIIVFRCQNGVVAWGETQVSPTDRRWQCGRDATFVAKPDTLVAAEQALLTMSTHSAQLAGAIQQVVEFNI